MESNDSNKKILFSIQILIFYLSDSKEFDRNKKIKEIINDNFLPNFASGYTAEPGRFRMREVRYFQHI